MMKCVFICEFKIFDIPFEVSDNFITYAYLYNNFNILHNFYKTINTMVFNIMMIDNTQKIIYCIFQFNMLVLSKMTTVRFIEFLAE